MKTIPILIALFVASFSTKASVVPVQAYYESKDEPFMISYIWGVSSGIQFATAINSDKGGNNLFCVPDDVVITNDDSIGIFEREIYDSAGKKKYPDDTPISLVYLFALEKLYPCK